MCRRIECSKCKKPTYAGCGRHIEQVLGDVPAAERCRCAEKADAPAEGSAKGEVSLFRRFFGR